MSDAARRLVSGDCGACDERDSLSKEDRIVLLNVAMYGGDPCFNESVIASLLRRGLIVSYKTWGTTDKGRKMLGGSHA